MPRVYPRPRGEYAIRKALRLALAGLPPPTRGIRRRVCERGRASGSTPAHAGNTFAQGVMM